MCFAAVASGWQGVPDSCDFAGHCLPADDVGKFAVAEALRVKSHARDHSRRLAESRRQDATLCAVVTRHWASLLLFSRPTIHHFVVSNSGCPANPVRVHVVLIVVQAACLSSRHPSTSMKIAGSTNRVNAVEATRAPSMLTANGTMNNNSSLRS